MTKRIDILPGGELSDVVEHELGTTHHELVKNLRQVRVGEWEIVPGHILHYYNPGMDIKAAEEVTDDQSGDRFMIIQDGTALKRIDWDPATGYQSASPSTLTLPTGVSIGATTVCKFFVYAGTVRIAGPIVTATSVGCPLWYGYINRTLFPDAWRRVYLGGFETDTESWTAVNTTLSRYDCDADGDGAGMWGAPELQYALKVAQTSDTGTARKSFTVGVGKTIRVLAMVFTKSGGSNIIQIKLGTAAGGNQYETLSTTTKDEWVMLESSEFVASSATLHVELNPGSISGNDIAYFDFIMIEENNPITVSGWKLQKAELTAHDVDVEFLDQLVIHDDTDADLTRRGLFGKSFFTYDESQCSLPKAMTRSASRSTIPEVSVNNIFDGMDGEIGYGHFSKMGIDFRIKGSNLVSTFLNNRLTGFGVGIGAINDGDPLIASTVAYYAAKDLDFSKELDPVNYVSEHLQRQNDTATYPNYLWRGGYRASSGYPEDLHWKVGSRITISTEDGTLSTVITQADEGTTGVTVAHPVAVLGGGAPDGSGYITFENALINIENIWDYDAALGYATRITFDAMDLSSSELYDYLDIPAGTSDNTPDYDQHVIVGSRGFVISNEAGEEDVTRYSPLDQPDNLPNLNIESITSGDNDRALYIGNLDERLVVLKKRTLNQIRVSGDQFYSDIKIALQGLYAGVRGARVVESVLYFMDQNDVFMFDKNRCIPLMYTEKMRTRYKENVDTSSFLLWDKLNNELQVHLKSTANILVWHPEMKEWYERETEFTTKLGGYLDADNKLIMFTPLALVTQNHSSTTGFAENMSFEINTLFLDGSNPENYKSIDKVMVQILCNRAITVEIKDPNDARTYSKGLTPSSTVMGVVEDYPAYLFREAQITVKNTAAYSALAGKIKRVSMEVAAWR